MLWIFSAYGSVLCARVEHRTAEIIDPAPSLVTQAALGPEQKFRQLLAEMRIEEPLSGCLPLVPEVSQRRYFRLQFPSGKTLIGVEEDPKTAAVNMRLTAQIAQFLRAQNVAVPTIYAFDVQLGAMLEQDLGDTSFNLCCKQNSDHREALYKDAILHMLCWQRSRDDNCAAFQYSFDTEKLLFEFEFFITHTLLGYYNAGPSEGELTQLRAQFSRIAEILAAPTHKVFTHRDYHSRNIMVHEGSQYIIDFQDARLGLFQYDLCSLLCDAYAPLPSTLRDHLLDFAFVEGRSVHRQTRTEFDYYWRLSAFQRIIKAMGTFGKEARAGRREFAAYLPIALQTLREICSGEAELERLLQVLSRLIGENCYMP